MKEFLFLVSIPIFFTKMAVLNRRNLAVCCPKRTTTPRTCLSHGIRHTEHKAFPISTTSTAGAFYTLLLLVLLFRQCMDVLDTMAAAAAAGCAAAPTTAAVTAATAVTCTTASTTSVASLFTGPCTSPGNIHVRCRCTLVTEWYS